MSIDEQISAFSLHSKENLGSWQSSPNMAGLVFNAYTSGTYSSSQVISIESAYLNAIDNGGNKEIDFIREDGVSFNPRVARVAFIQLKEEGLECFETLIFNLNRIDKEVLDFKNQDRNEKLISSFHWLDRARHLHLAPKSKLKELYKIVSVEGELIEDFSKEEKLNLSNKISFFNSRLKNSLSKLG